MGTRSHMCHGGWEVWVHGVYAIICMSKLIPVRSMVSYYVCCGNYIYIYRVSHEECARLRESVPYVKVYRYNPKHLHPKLNGYGDNGQRSLKL